MNHQVNPYRTMNRILEQCRAKCFASAVNFGLRKCVCRICTEAELEAFSTLRLARKYLAVNRVCSSVRRSISIREKDNQDTYVLLDGGAPKVIRIDTKEIHSHAPKTFREQLLYLLFFLLLLLVGLFALSITLLIRDLF